MKQGECSQASSQYESDVSHAWLQITYTSSGKNKWEEPTDRIKLHSHSSSCTILSVTLTKKRMLIAEIWDDTNEGWCIERN